MPVLLHGCGIYPDDQIWTGWCAVDPDAGAGLPRERRVNLSVRLEDALTAIRSEWWNLGRILAATPTAELAHMPTCGTYSSDTGLMMAWVHVVTQLAADPATTLVICPDPWVFRQMAALPGVQAGRAPSILPQVVRLRLRGMLARCKVAATVAVAAVKTRATRKNHGQGDAVIQVYGHPASTPQGKDAYFGDLMIRQPDLKRMMHTDCPAGRALELAADGRTASLHAWGNPLKAAGLVFARWRPTAEQCRGPYGPLIQRAAEKEGGGGAAALNRWQMWCHRAWLADRKPAVIAWPWENHPYERDLVRSARARGVRTVGYQHTVMGPHMFNQSPQPNPDGLGSIPDLLVANGPAYARQLADWGIPAQRLAIGGAFRLPPVRMTFDAAAPVFVALSNDANKNDQILAALESMADSGLTFLLKEHPMYPYAFSETATIRRTNAYMPDAGPLRAVLYSTGTSGLEALAGGLPTFRFRPDGIIALDILPPGVLAVTVDAGTLRVALSAPLTPPDLRREDVLADVDYAFWRAILAASAIQDKASDAQAISVGAA
ncbi:MAG: hypothetical protein K2X44_08215 [Magnetospirillum sp.]|nr:hypothetical protein [Magnetospirillum sp.]